MDYNMTIEIIEFNNIDYPAFQIECASQFIIPFAKKLCKGDGYDIGCGKEEWAFPGAIPIDIELKNNKWNAMNLPLDKKVDYVFSSHCLEHLENWVEALNYWTSKIKVGGVLFLYLPHWVQEYWRPWNNKKHKACLSPEMIRDYMKTLGYIKIFNSQWDLNYSFTVIGEKGETVQ